MNENKGQGGKCVGLTVGLVLFGVVVLVVAIVIKKRQGRDADDRPILNGDDRGYVNS
jgi:hypothetical protein